MPARINKRHQDMIREKIRGSQLVNRLENHILPDDKTGQVVDMTPTQVNAALGLLKKVIPDLRASEISGEIEAKLNGTVEFVSTSRKD